MGKINGCLKCVFIFFNVLFAILGGFLIYGFVSISGSQQEQLSSADVPGLVWGWLLAIGILGISSLGIFAACSEKPLALKLFATFMGIGMIIMLYMGINVANSRPQMMSEVKKYSGEIVQFLMKQNGMTLEELQEFVMVFFCTISLYVSPTASAVTDIEMQSNDQVQKTILNLTKLHFKVVSLSTSGWINGCSFF